MRTSTRFAAGIFPILLVAGASTGFAADSTRTESRPPRSLLVVARGQGTESSLVAAPSLLTDRAVAAQPTSIPAHVAPVKDLPYPGAHLDGQPVWNWDSPYSLGTGLWSRSYAENSMQERHDDPQKTRRNWIFTPR